MFSLLLSFWNKFELYEKCLELFPQPPLLKAACVFELYHERPYKLLWKDGTYTTVQFSRRNTPSTLLK